MTEDERQASDESTALPVQGRARPSLRASERELRAFLSSVMRGTLNDARQVVVDALDGVPFLSPWAFEYTPASSEAVDDSYLRHVRDADVVIWLACGEVTPPVVNEVREALAARRRLIVIRFGTEPRSLACEGLLAEVGLRAKYADATDLFELRAALELTVGDEIVRALRGQPDMGRLALIQALGAGSHARCVRRWQAPGLPRGEAVALAGDPSVGAPGASVVPSDSNPVILLSAEMGSGKSLAAERHLQHAIERLLLDGGAPVPVWLTATEARSGLRTCVQTACDGIGEPRLQGAAVVVDGLDEAGTAVAEQLLGEARELATALPRTTVLLTSRPLPLLASEPEHRTLPHLEDDQALAIVNIGAGEEVGFAIVASLPEPVKTSLRSPLFALLYGLTKRADPTLAPRSRGDLLAFLGVEARRRAGAEAEELLRRLAVASVRRELGPVPVAEVGRQSEIAPLLASGLVVERPGGLVLGLPVIAQWFAAQALLLGEITSAELCEAPDDVDLWRYPLAIAVATASHDDAAALLGPLMDAIPGFAFLVIDEALGTATLEGIAAPPWLQAGTQMRQAMQTMADGLADLAGLAFPLDADGQLLPLGANASGEHVDYAVWVGDEPRDDVFRLRHDRSFFDPEPGLSMVGFAAVGRGSAWAWRWARDRLRHELQELFKARALPYSPGGPAQAEATWLLATTLADRNPLFVDQIDIEPLLDRLEKTVADAERHHANSVSLLTRGGEVDATTACDALRALRARGVTQLTSPHPVSDQRPNGGGMIGDYYSEERLLSFATSIYEQALVVYEDLVAHAFSAVADRLVLHVTLPARYVGFLDPRDTESDRWRRMPVLSGYFEPLPSGEPSVVDIRTSRDRFDLSTDHGLVDRLRSRRPEAARWITGWTGGGVFPMTNSTPSSALAYGWLWRDLAHTRIVSGMQPS